MIWEVKEMELIYAAMLLHKAGKEISEHNVKKVLEAAGIKKEDAQVKALVAALDGVDIEKAIKDAASVPVAAAHSSAPAGEHKASSKKEKRSQKRTRKRKRQRPLLGLAHYSVKLKKSADKWKQASVKSS